MPTTVTCDNCGASTRPPNGVKFLFCPICGSKISYDKKARAAAQAQRGTKDTPSPQRDSQHF